LADSVEVDVVVNGAEEALSSLDGLVEAFASVQKEGNIDLGDSISQFEEANTTAKELTTTLADVAPAAEDLVGGFKDSTGEMENFNSAAKDTVSVSGEIQTGVEGVTTGLSDYNSVAGESATTTESLATGLTPLGGLLGETATATDTLNTSLADTTTVVESGTSGLADYGAGWDTVASSVQAGLTPVQEMATTLEGMGGIFTEAGTQAETFNGALVSLNETSLAASGSLTDTNLLTENLALGMGEAGTSTESFSNSTASAIGNITALGGTLGTAVSLVFRLQDAQLRLDRANISASRSTEIARKAQVALNTLIAEVPNNVNNVTIAFQEYQTALANLKALQDAGITTGAEYEAASMAVEAAIQALRAAFVAGGGDVNKFDSALNKATLTTQNAELRVRNAEKAQRQFNLTMLDAPFAVAGFAGTLVQTIANLGTMATSLRTVGTQMKTVFGVGLAGAASALGVFTLAAVAAYEVLKLIETLPAAFDVFSAAAENDIPKATAAFDEFVQKAKEVPGVAQVLGSSLDTANNTLKGLNKETEVMNKIFPTLSSGAKTTGEAFQATGGQTKTMGSEMNLSGTEAAQLANMIGQVPPVQKELEASTAKTTSAFQGVTVAGKQYTEVLDAQGNVIGMQQGPVNTLQTSYLTLEQAMADGVFTAEEQKSVTEGQTAAMQASANAAALSTNAMSPLSQVMSATTSGATGLTTAYQAWNTEQQSAAVGIQQFTTEMVGLLGTTPQAAAKILEFAEFMGLNTEEVQKNLEAMGIHIDETAKMGEAVAAAKAKLDEENTSLQVQAQVLASTDGRQKIYNNTLLQLQNSLAQNSIELQANAAFLADVGNQTQIVANAVLEEKNSLVQANLELQAHAQVLQDAESLGLMFQNALLEISNSLKEEEVQLRAAGAAMQDHANELQTLINAYLEGRNSVDEFIAGLQQSRVETQGAIDRFAELGFSIGTIPKFMPPTVESLETLAQAALGTGEQAVEATTAMTDAWREVHPTMVGLLDSLTEAFGKSGDEQKDAVKQAWESLPEDVEGFLSEMDKKGIEGMARFTEDLNSGFAAFDILDALGKTEEGMDAFMQIFEDAKDQAPATWGIMFDEIESIAKSGSSAMMAEMRKAIEEGGDPKVVEAKLKAIIKKHESAVDEITQQWLRIREIDPGAIDPTAGIGERIGALKKFGSEDDRIRKEAKAKEKAMETDPFAHIAESAKTADAAVQAAIDQMVANISTKWVTLMTTLRTSAQQHGTLVGTALGTGIATGLTTATTTLLTTWTSVTTTLTTSATQFGTIIGTNLGTGINTGITTALATIMTTWTSITTTLTSSALQFGTLIGTNLGTGINTGITTSLATIMTSWVSVMTTLNTSATQWGALIGAALFVPINTLFASEGLLLLGQWVTLMTTLSTSATQWGTIIGTALFVPINTTFATEGLLLVGQWVTLMTTLSTSATQWGTIIGSALFMPINTTFATEGLLLLGQWVVLMTTLNTSALQWGTLIGTSLFLNLNAQLVLQQTVLLTTWVTLMTTLNTSALQWGTLVGVSLVTGLTVAITTATTVLLTQWTTFTTSLVVLTGTATVGITQLIIAMQTSITTSFATIQSAATSFGVSVAGSFNKVSTSALTLRNNVLAMQTGMTSSFATIQSAGQSMAVSITGSFNKTSTSALTLRNNVQQLADDFGSAMEEMISHVENFASAFVSSMGEVTSAAEDATQAVEDLQSAIDNLKDKTVTITTKFVTQGKPAGQHGGSFIIDSPRTFGGVKVGEHHKPELLTVTPLTNPNRISDKTINMGRLTAATSKGMQKGGQLLSGINIDVTQSELLKQVIRELIQVKNAVNSQQMVANTILDGRLIDQTIQKSRSRKTETFT
jgi:exonuclease VII small subunit